MSIKTEIRGPSPRCLFPRKELFVYFSESHRDSTIALRVEIFHLRVYCCVFFVRTRGHIPMYACACRLSNFDHGLTHVRELCAVLLRYTP